MSEWEEDIEAAADELGKEPEVPAQEEEPEVPVKEEEPVPPRGRGPGRPLGDIKVRPWETPRQSEDELFTETRHHEFELKPIHYQFVRAYLDDPNRNIAAAMRSVGYAGRDPGGAGYRLLRIPEIEALVRAGQLQLSDYLNVTPSKTLQEWAKVAFANIDDFLEHNEDGSRPEAPHVDLSKCTREQMAAIGEIQTKEYTKGKGEGQYEVREIKVKFHSKTAALESLSRILGQFQVDNEQSAVKALLPVLQIRVDGPKPVEATVVERGREDL
jgi:hypothetical protein